MNLHPNNAKTRIVNGAVVCEPRRKYVAIVGFGPTSMDVRSIQNDPDWEIWGLNNGYMNPCMWDGPLVTGPIIENAEGRHRVFDVEQQTANLRVDRWWEMHPMRVQPSYDVEWLGKCPVPVYLLHDLNQGDSAILRRWPKSPSYAPESLPSMPNAVTYPLAAMEAAVPLPMPFFASTFAYQIALATALGFDSIGFFGLEFGTTREVMFERGNALFWAGFASGHGLRMAIPKMTNFLEGIDLAVPMNPALQFPMTSAFEWLSIRPRLMFWAGHAIAQDPERITEPWVAALCQHGNGARYGYQYDEEVQWCTEKIAQVREIVQSTA